MMTSFKVKIRSLKLSTPRASRCSGLSDRRPSTMAGQAKVDDLSGLVNLCNVLVKIKKSDKQGLVSNILLLRKVIITC